MQRIRILTPAKVNLFLRVTGRRSDGFHEIISLMDPVSLYDEVTVSVEDGEGITVSSDCPHIPEGPDNIAFRAAELFLEEAGLRRRVVVEIKKSIPVGAGLGGGSSDSAAVLKALNVLLHAGLDEGRLMDLGARLGSDVPFFIPASPAIVRGRGEKIERVDIPPYHYIIVNPCFSVSTAHVYANLHLTKKAENNILSFSKNPPAGHRGIRELLHNDLEAVTAGMHPEINELKRALMDAGACGSLMSGSGPTVFGLFVERESAFEALDVLKKRGLNRSCSLFLASGRTRAVVRPFSPDPAG